MYKLPPRSDTDQQSDQGANTKEDQLHPFSCATADAGAGKHQTLLNEQAGCKLEASPHPPSSPPVTPQRQDEHGPQISSVSPSSSACPGTADSSSKSSSTTISAATATTSTSSTCTYNTTISASASTDLNTSGTTFTNTSASTTGSAIASFSDLPLHLQSSILAHAVAPPSTCKAAAAIKEDPCLLAIWLGNNERTTAWCIRAAAFKGKWQVVSQMVSMGFRCEPDDLELSFVLCAAAKAGQLEVVQHLLGAGAWESTAWGEVKLVRECSCDPTDWYYCEHWERWRHDEEELAGLIEQGHPLVLAARNGHADVCSLLLKQGIHVGVVHEALCAAAAGGHVAVIQRLLQEGPAGLSQLADASNAMFTAAAAGHLDVVQFFLGQGADLYSFSGTPWAGVSDFTSCLEAAAAGGNPELLQLLINDNGMAVEPDWPKVLEAAVRSGNDEAVRVLLCAAAAEGQDGVFISSSSHASPPRMLEASQLQLQQQQQEQHQFLAECLKTYQLLQLRALLPVWAQLDEALLLAASLGHTKVATQLLTCGGSRFTQHLLSCALQAAASKGCLGLMSPLIMLGADVNAVIQGPYSLEPEYGRGRKAHALFYQGYPLGHVYTPLGQAMMGGQWTAFELLKAFGAQPCDQTVAFATYRCAPARIIKLLLDMGFRDVEYNAGIYAAAHDGQQDVVELLLDVDQRSVSSEELAARFDAALSGAVHGRRPQMVDMLCTALSRAQESGQCPAANRLNILNSALMLAVKPVEYSLQQVVLPAPAAINQLGGQGLPAAGDAQEGVAPAANDIPAQQQEQQPLAEAAYTTQLVPTVYPATINHVRVVQCLLQHGADPDHAQGEVLAEAVRRQYMEGAISCHDHVILQLLLDAGASDIDAALVAAAETGDKAAVPKLVAAVQGPVDPAGKALLAAAAHNNTGVVASLIDLKANVAAALSAAAASDKVQAATVILEHFQVRVTDQGLKQQLVDLAARSQSFSLLWALSKAVGMLDDCVLPERV